MRPRSPQSRRMIGGGVEPTSRPRWRQDADIVRADFKGRPGARRRRSELEPAGAPGLVAGERARVALVDRLSAAGADVEMAGVVDRFVILAIDVVEFPRHGIVLKRAAWGGWGAMAPS